MRSAATPASVGLATFVFVGCTIMSPPDPRLCSAAQNMSAAVALTETAIAADAAGDAARAQGLATQARTVGELSLSLLQGVPDARHAENIWQRLADAYGHMGAAANSLLPAYADRHGIGPQELALAERSMADARRDLPEMCFGIPGDLETPGPR